MFRNYLVTALRNLGRNWLYGAISILGLAVAFTMEPKTIRPGVRIAFLTAPENVSIELIQRG